MTDIASKVITTVSEHFGVPADSVKTESTLKDLGADSLDRIELVMALEDDFEVGIPDEDAEKFVSIQNVVDYITAQKA